MVQYKSDDALKEHLSRCRWTIYEACGRDFIFAELSHMHTCTHHLEMIHNSCAKEMNKPKSAAMMLQEQSRPPLSLPLSVCRRVFRFH